MAHYAFIDDNNVVTEVITGVSEDELIEGKTPEEWYSEFRGQKCLRTSYNTQNNQHRFGGTPFRGNYAGIGYIYDEQWDIFIPPKPYNSWVFNYPGARWEPPIPRPEDEDGYYWKWGEHNAEWVKLPVA